MTSILKITKLQLLMQSEYNSFNGSEWSVSLCSRYRSKHLIPPSPSSTSHLYLSKCFLLFDFSLNLSFICRLKICTTKNICLSRTTNWGKSWHLCQFCNKCVRLIKGHITKGKTFYILLIFFQQNLVFIIWWYFSQIFVDVFFFLRFPSINNE